MNEFNFGLAFNKERIVFGAARPGRNSDHPKQVAFNYIREWIAFMKDRGIKRVCCLLPDDQLKFYVPDANILLDTYWKEFGQDNVCSAPNVDFELCDTTLLRRTILPFLRTSDVNQDKVVVHCSAGIGRTARILAAWLVNKYKVTPEEAITMTSSENNVVREPYEGLLSKDKDKLLKQLGECTID